MNLRQVIGMFAILFSSAAGGQQQGRSIAPPPSGGAPPSTVKVYAPGPGVMAPELLQLKFVPLSTEKCKTKLDGKVLLSILVDTEGRPQNIMFLHALGTGLDRFALRIASADRFKPGMADGKPVVVAQSLEVGIQSCVEQSVDSAGNKTLSLRLRSVPTQSLETAIQPPAEAVFAEDDTSWKDPDRVYHVRDGVSPPIVLNNVEAAFTDAARNAKYDGQAVLTLIVDEHGLPEDLKVVRPLDYGLTGKAVEAANRYRFKPAMKNGQPMPVLITVVVNFKLR